MFRQNLKNLIHSRIFHSNWDIAIANGGLQTLTYIWHSWQEVTNTTLEITTNLFYLKSKQHHTWKAFCHLQLNFRMTFLILWSLSPTLSSLKKHVKVFFSKTPKGLYHFGACRCNIKHRQLKNCSSNLYKDLFDHYLSNSPACRKLRTPFIIF